MSWKYTVTEAKAVNIYLCSAIIALAGAETLPGLFRPISLEHMNICRLAVQYYL